MTRVLVSIVAAAYALFAQTPDGPKTFEVASVRPNLSGSGDSGTRSSLGEIRMENVSLKQCIETAFDVKDYALSGPPWLDTPRFDIVAKLPNPAGSTVEFGRNFREMFQNLLADRFKLAVHRESKPLPAYALLVDKKGLKIKPVEEGPSGSGSGRGHLDAHRVSMKEFAELLSSNLDRPVKDLTETQGVFEFKLEWTPDDTPPGAAPDGRTSASLFAAMQEQLGLRLEARKLPIEILVIDHVEKTPTGN